MAHYGGIVSGHFHTAVYDRETLAEIWQKQAGSSFEEQRIFAMLNKGMRLGIVGGSDTHDSMPGNPDPEPGCPQTAGFMAVVADELTPEAIRQAIISRRVYATSGARIAMHFESSGRPMGSVLNASQPGEFYARVEGAGELSLLELLRDGTPIVTQAPGRVDFEDVLSDTTVDSAGSHWYMLRVTQADGHRAWSSPIWFENTT